MESVKAIMMYGIDLFQTYGAFVKEAGLPDDAGTTGPGDWTIEQILEEKKQYDSSLSFEKKPTENVHGWKLPGKRTSLATLARISPFDNKI